MLWEACQNKFAAFKYRNYEKREKSCQGKQDGKGEAEVGTLVKNIEAKYS